jgi:hypothetical protein
MLLNGTSLLVFAPFILLSLTKPGQVRKNTVRTVGANAAPPQPPA